MRGGEGESTRAAKSFNGPGCPTSIVPLFLAVKHARLSSLPLPPRVGVADCDRHRRSGSSDLALLD